MFQYIIQTRRGAKIPVRRQWYNGQARWLLYPAGARGWSTQLGQVAGQPIGGKGRGKGLVNPERQEAGQSSGGQGAGQPNGGKGMVYPVGARAFRRPSGGKGATGNRPCHPASYISLACHRWIVRNFNSVRPAVRILKNEKISRFLSQIAFENIFSQKGFSYEPLIRRSDCDSKSSTYRIDDGCVHLGDGERVETVGADDEVGDWVKL